MTSVRVPEQVPARARRSRWLVLLAALAAAAVALAVIAVVVTRDDDQADAGTAAQLSRVEASCEDWMTSSTAGSQSDDGWCRDMFGWIGDQSDGSMMGSMMWQGPEQLGQACREWAGRERTGSEASGKQSCDDMVEWMEGHMSSRNGRWMMSGR